jgi:hypothetical protein
MDINDYFDLTTQNIEDLIIERVDNFDCVMKDDERSYKGFVLAKSSTGSVFTVCDISFHMSGTDNKYQPRLIFRKTDGNLNDRNAKSDATHIRIPFHSGAEGYREFWKMIAFLYRFKDLIDVGQFDDTFQVVITDQNSAQYIRELLEKGYSEDLWQALVETNPDLATRLSYARLHQDRSDVLREFESSLGDPSKDEDYWSNFFETNQWIFGYGLKYAFLNPVTGQPQYGGRNVFGSGAQRGDHLLRSEGEVKFTVLVEIKKPTTRLLRNSTYRNGVYELSQELTGATSQIQVNCKKWELEGSRTDGNRDQLDENGIFTYEPKGLLVVGNLAELDERDKRNTFQAYRSQIHNPEIITFDELYERARYIVSNEEVPERLQENTEPVTQPETIIEESTVETDDFQF